MTDIFISYARSTEREAEQVAEALRALGHEVWRDDELPAHRAYGDVIEERLKAAEGGGRAVVGGSGEVAMGAGRGRCRARSRARWSRSASTARIPPMPFNQIQCADLNGWDGDVDAPGWRKVVGSVAGAGRRRRQAPKPRACRRRRKLSICVLPFANMSGDAEQEYFSDGISEDIITDLTKVSALAVIARNTAFTFKGQPVDVREVARKLGVSHVLEGSVRKAGGRVRITAQLIDGATGDHVWAERYDRDLTDIFALQDEISKAIVEALKLKLLPEEKKAIEQRGTTNVEAYNLYLMARQLLDHGQLRRRPAR